MEDVYFKLIFNTLQAFQIVLPRFQTCSMDFLHNLYKTKKRSIGAKLPGLDNLQVIPCRNKEATFYEARIEKWYPYLNNFKD